MNEWHWIHDFFNGFGFQESIPDNKVVTEDHSDEPIPWQVVHDKQPEKQIWLCDTSRLLGITDLSRTTSEELYEIHYKLQPLLKAEFEKWKENQKPVEFKRITIPKINKFYPKLLW